jgi:UDP-glucose 4-epimerase
MKALVTGGLGYIGSATALSLADLGHEVLIFDDARDSVAGRELFKGSVRDWLGFAIDDPQNVPAAVGRFRPDVIFHFAGTTSVGQGEDNPDECADNNVGAFARFLSMLPADGPAKIVHAGSAAVYAPSFFPVTEGALLGPSSFYGETKLMAEKLLIAMARRKKLSFVGLRYFNVVGQLFGIKERRKREEHLIPRLMIAVEKGEAFHVNGTDFPTADGTAVRDYVHIEDVVRANIRAAEALMDPSQTGIHGEFFNIGSGVGSSVWGVLAAFHKVSGKTGPVVSDGPRRPGDSGVLVSDVGKASRVLGWRPRRPLKEAIESVVSR